jgi:3-hydroxybutyryl-CoA dehydratase
MRLAITQETIDAWAQMTGDRNPLHVDEDFARASPFGGTIAHGHLALAAMLEVVAASRPTAFALREVRYRSPLRPGHDYAVSIDGSGHVEVRGASDGVVVADGRVDDSGNRELGSAVPVRRRSGRGSSSTRG